jgi:hypothetical protein
VNSFWRISSKIILLIGARVHRKRYHLDLCVNLIVCLPKIPIKSLLNHTCVLL